MTTAEEDRRSGTNRRPRAVGSLESQRGSRLQRRKGTTASLVRRDYWEELYKSRSASRTRNGGFLLSALRNTEFVRYLKDGGYTNYVSFKTIDKYLPRRKDWRVIEIGSAPGHRLVQLWQRYDYEPYGVEYTETGVEINREVFRQQGLNPENVIFGDLFDDRFIEAHQGKFDVVCSFGFIEHFGDPRKAVLNHFKLLSPGGILLVSIPNLSGVNLYITKFFHRRILQIHNLGIMERDVFRQMFSGLPMQPLYCDYLGPFTLKIQNTPPGSWKRWLLKLASVAEVPFDVALRAYGVVGVPGNQLFSPTLLYVGKAESPNE